MLCFVVNGCCTRTIRIRVRHHYDGCNKLCESGPVQQSTIPVHELSRLDGRWLCSGWKSMLSILLFSSKMDHNRLPIIRRFACLLVEPRSAASLPEKAGRNILRSIWLRPLVKENRMRSQHDRRTRLSQPISIAKLLPMLDFHWLAAWLFWSRWCNVRAALLKNQAAIWWTTGAWMLREYI